MNDLIDVVATDVVKSCVKIRMYINNFTLKASDCTVTVEKYDESTRIIDVVQVYISPEEYRGWSYEDQYIIELVLAKLGLQPDQVLVEEPAP